MILGALCSLVVILKHGTEGVGKTHIGNHHFSHLLLVLVQAQTTLLAGRFML